MAKTFDLMQWPSPNPGLEQSFSSPKYLRFNGKLSTLFGNVCGAVDSLTERYNVPVDL